MPKLARDPEFPPSEEVKEPISAGFCEVGASACLASAGLRDARMVSQRIVSKASEAFGTITQKAGSASVLPKTSGGAAATWADRPVSST